jgi:hypothetical protein
MAVVVLNEQLTLEQLLSAVQPLLSDAARPKAMFESKRCCTELRHWGVKLAGDLLEGPGGGGQLAGVHTGFKSRDLWLCV